jgi:hypothetical protein
MAGIFKAYDVRTYPFHIRVRDSAELFRELEDTYSDGEQEHIGGTL